MDSPSYWRLNLYEQIATVNVNDAFAIIKLHITIDDTEVIYTGTIGIITATLSEDERFITTLKGANLTITTHGIPFLIDTPSSGVKISIDIEEDFVLAFAPTVARHKIVNAYHQELISAIISESLYPTSTDWHLYPNYKNYYKAVLAQILPDLNCDKLSSLSRHEFFIATSPIQHPKTQQWMAGTSGLAQLMGFSIPDEIKEPDPEEPEKKDDTLLSAITGALLIFKGRAGWVTQNFSLSELSYLLTTASERIRAANAEMDKRFGNKNATQTATLPEVQPAVESNKWKEVKGNAIAQLNEMNIPMPKGF